MKSHDLTYWNINLPTKNGGTSIQIPVYPGSRLAIIKASQTPFYIGETNSFGNKRIKSIAKKTFCYEIKLGGPLIIEKNESHKILNVEINFI
jgi:hypothetical protein